MIEKKPNSDLRIIKSVSLLRGIEVVAKIGILSRKAASGEERRLHHFTECERFKKCLLWIKKSTGSTDNEYPDLSCLICPRYNPALQSPVRLKITP